MIYARHNLQRPATEVEGQLTAPKDEAPIVVPEGNPGEPVVQGALQTLQTAFLA